MIKKPFKEILALGFLIAFTVACEKPQNTPSQDPLDGPEMLVSQTNVGTLHNDFMDYVIYDPEMSGTYDLSHFNHIKSQLHDFMVNEEGYLSADAASKINTVVNTHFASSINPFNVSSGYVDYANSINEVYNAGKISETAKTNLMNVFDGIFNNTITQSEINDYFDEIGTVGGTAQQVENHMAIRNIYESSLEYWSINWPLGSSKTSLFDSDKDKEIWTIAATDLLGGLHGSIWGPWGIFIEAIISSALAADILND